MKRIIVLMAFVWLCMHTNAQFKLSGTVRDGNGEKLVGASVVIVGTSIGTNTDLDGTFELNAVPEGKHKLLVSFTGFESYSEDIDFQSNNNLAIVLKESALVVEEVVVSSIRAQKSTPTTYSLVSKTDLTKSNTGQDAPYLLAMEPSVVVSSDAGTGIGYTSMHIRGSDNKKINVTINGVPLNDPESHGVYWVDVPDIASSAQSIQIQRGVGTSTNGSGAFGASINILTDNVSQKPFVEYSVAAGSFGTYKNNLQISSGLLNNHWFLEAKAGQIKSDGYRDRASSDLRNYFAQAGYSSEKTIIKLVSFGGYEETYQAWYGINKATLAINRKYNPAGLISTDSTGKETYYDKMVDHYRQDHLQLHYAHKFNDELSFNAALHYTYGRGYYQDYVPVLWEMPLSGFNLPNIIRGNDTIQYSDLVHRLWLKNYFYGEVWGLHYSKDKINITWGGGINKYEPANHYGEVIWAKEPEIKLDGKHYYDNDASKTDWNNYLKINYSALENLSIYTDLQVRGINYDAWGTSKEYENRNISINKNYLFFNPKFGLFYQINPKTNIYASFAIANREPNRSDFLGAPNGQTPKHETLQDWEFGIRQNNTRFNIELVLYNMNYVNQLVLTGELDSEGTPLRKNVLDSYRRGVELSYGILPNEFLKYEGNFALSANKIVDYPTQDSINAPVIKKTLDIAFSPSLIVSQKLTFIPIKNLELSFLGKYVSKQYLNNSQNNAQSLDSYFVSDFIANYNFNMNNAGSLSIYLKVNNILNKLYQSNGAIDYDGSPLYFPQAGRNFMFGIIYKF